MKWALRVRHNVLVVVVGKAEGAVREVRVLAVASRDVAPDQSDADEQEGHRRLIERNRLVRLHDEFGFCLDERTLQLNIQNDFRYDPIFLSFE